MTLDEAIKHCEEVAEEQEQKAQCMGRQFVGTAMANYQNGCFECAADHRQLAEWLTELKEHRAADVQPVKRGEWEKKSSVGVFRCSLCHHIFMLGADEIDEYHFCPNCGADMRGDENG